MASLPATESLKSEAELPPPTSIENASHHEAGRAEWVLDSPDPPSLWHDLLVSIRETLLLNNSNDDKKKSPLTHKQALCRGAASLFQGLFPILCWGKSYRISKFKSDLMAGLTLASLCIPQSIGYASLAKLDPQYGLYTSVVPPLVYALMGSSREIAIGPVAVVSLLLSSMIQNIQDPLTDPGAYRSLVFTVTFFAGTFQAIFGLFRLGFLVGFLSHAAIVGFMAGTAIIIGLQQLKGLLGISHFTTKTDAVSVLESAFRSIHHQGRRNKKLFWLPAVAPLVSVVLSTLIVFLTKADNHGVKVVKHIKGGLNPSSAHQLQFGGPHVGQSAKIGLICAAVALTEAIAVGRSFASIKGYQIDGNKEMVAMGFMNIAGSLTSCYVATGSFSRTAVNFSAGCQTVVSNIVMAVTVLLSLLLFTKLLYYTPMAILASIILSALPGLIDVSEALRIWRVDKLDFLACIGAFLGVLFGSVEIGLLAAVAISFGKVILLSIRPGTELLGKLPGTEIFCDIRQYPMAIETPGVFLVRINSGLMCFANANFIRERIMRSVTEEDDARRTERSKIQVVVLDMSNVMNIDTSGIAALEELHKELVSVGLEVAMANIRWQVIHQLKLANFLDKIGKERVFLSVGEAVKYSCVSSKFTGPTNC
ncbi:low affinity sulfate transporter 3-like isoform X2 [Syzygium oleosum]|uniref:low affinity sulfate transporter 3-like isoform X2 n=1 Tax=Syzygium oleosum TaxID=219896 RepID=UPI0024B92771|nr:low affinity sulfate transporter 3-like isoform X2 [Syzygium oleosum]